jgi:rhodanese-related sulfurtransferase
MFERVHDWQAWKAAGGAILDVRERFEVAMGTLPDAIHIPLGELPHRRSELGDEPVLVICRSGSRSEQAARFLAGCGHRAANLEGGLLALGRA